MSLFEVGPKFMARLEYWLHAAPSIAARTMTDDLPTNLPRLYVDSPLATGDEVPATEPQAHYLLHVMRRAAGAGVVLFNGRDGEWAATLAPRGKKALAYLVGARRRIQDAAPPVTLFFAPLKSHRLEFLVEKATELGVGTLVPVLCRRAVASRVNVARLRAIAVEAAEQCERLTVPEIAAPLPVEAVGARCGADAPLLLLDEAGARAGTAMPLAAALRAQGGPAAFLVGPEGGFAPEERAALLAAGTVTAITLGPRILRAETAALAALACWQALCGDGAGPPGGRNRPAAPETAGI
jgi:16S rRNA (uracil1498-N3)-methyltransferase